MKLNIIEGGFNSGKTEYLINKFSEILNEGVSLNEILFIHSQPDLIKEKIKKNLKRGYSEIHIDTVTGFCKWFLRKYQDKLSFPKPGFRVISGLEERLILKKILKDSKLKNFISSVSSFIDLYKLNFYPSPPDIGKKYPEFISAFRKYQKFLKKRNWLDLRDLVIYSITFIEKNPEIIRELGFKYIFVDEAENLDYNSFVLIEKFFEKAESAFISVNPDGAIFLFRGGLGKDILKLLKRYEKNEIKLESKNEKIEIEVSSHLDEYLEVLWVLRKIRKLLREGVKPEEIAIIIRDFDIRVKLLEELSKVYSIPLEVSSGVFVFKEPLLIQFISFLSLLDEKNLIDENLVFKAISSPYFSDEKYNSFYITSRNKKINFFEFLKEREDENRKLKNFFEALKRIKEFSKNRKLIDVIYLAYKEAGFEEFCLKDINVSRIFSFFFDMVLRFSEIFPDETIESFLAQIEEVIEFYGRGSYFELKDTVKLLTVHEAGGRKFNFVFLLGASDGNFPREYKLDTFPYFNDKERKAFNIKPEYSLKEHIEEERRIFYKALSRGLKKVFISFVENRETNPSPFLKEIVFHKKIYPEAFLPERKEDILNLDEYNYFYSVNFKKFEEKNLVDRFYLPEDFKFTYSNIENYLRCPLSFYYSDILKIKMPLKWSQERGTIIHNVLMKLHSKYKKPPFPLDIENEIIEMVKEEFEKFGHLLLWERRHQERIIIDELLNYVREYKNFDVLEVEKKIEFEYEGFNFSIKLDRIDRIDSGYKIIDYKSGKKFGVTKRVFLNRFNRGKRDKQDIQFTLYYFALKNILNLPVEEVELIFLKEELTVLTLKINEIKEYIPLRIREIIDTCKKIKQGEFYFKKDNCYSCDYKEICIANEKEET